MKKMFSVILCLAVFSCGSKKGENPRVLMETKFGDIEIELFQTKAPKTVNAFLSFVDSNYYERASFYRVLNFDNQPINAPKSELIQGGIWKSNYQLHKRLKGVPHENTSATGILHTDGTISLARADTGTATTEFFICIGDQPGFDYGGKNNADSQGYAAFGRVTRGMDVVNKIYRQPEDEQAFDDPILIFKIKRL